MSTIIISFVISILMSAFITLILKKADKNNKTFDKLSRLYKRIEKELSALAEEKLQSLQDFDNCIEVSIQKGSCLLEEVKRSVAEIEERFAGIEDEKEKISVYYQKIDTIDSEIMNIGEQVRDIHDSYDFIKSVDTKLSRFRKELALYERDINRIEDNFRKENTIALKEISKQIFKGTEDSVKSIKKNVISINKEIHSQRNKLISNVNNTENSLNEKIRVVQDMLSDFVERNEKTIKEKTGEYREELTKIDNDVTSLKNGFVKNMNNQLKEIGNSLLEKVNKINKVALDQIQEAKSDSIEQLKSKYDSVLDEISSFNENIKDETVKYIEKTFEQNHDQINAVIEELRGFENITDKKAGKLAKYLEKVKYNIENMKSSFTEDIESQIDEFNQKIKTTCESAEKLEGEIFGHIGNRLEKFGEQVDANISDINNKIEEKLSDSIKNINDTGEEVEMLRLSISKLSSVFNDEVKDITQRQNDLRTAIINEMNRYKSIADENVEDIKEYFNVEKKNVFKLINSALTDVKNDADNKTFGISHKIGQVYKKFEGKIKDIENSLVKKANAIENEVLIKAKDMEKVLLSNQESINDEMLDRLEVIRGELEGRQETINEELQSVKEEIDEKIYDFKGDVENIINDSSNDMQERLEKIGGKISEVESYLDSIERDFNSQISESYEGLDKLTGELSELKEQIDSDLTNRLEEGRELIEQVFTEGQEEIIERNNELKSETLELTEGYRDEINRVKEGFRAVNEQFDAKLDAKYNEVDSQLVKKMRDVNEIVGKIKNLNTKYSEQLNLFEERVQVIESDFTDKLETLEREFKDRGDAVLAEKSYLLSDINNRFIDLNESISTIKNTLSTDIDEKINEGKEVVDLMLAQNDARLSGRIKELENEALGKLEGYREDSDRLNSLLVRLETQFHAKIVELMDGADENVESRLKELNDEYNRQLENVKSNIESIELDFRDRTDEIENYYREKSDSLLVEKVSYIETLEERLGELNGELKGFQSELKSSIIDQVEAGKDEVGRVLAEGCRNLLNDYQALEDETKASLDKYKGDLKLVRKNIKVIDEKFTGRFLKKLNSADEKLKERLELLDDRYRSHLDEFKQNLETYKEDYSKKLTEAETLFDERAENLLADREGELAGYAERINLLVGEINEVKNSLDGDISRKISDGKAAMEHLYNRASDDIMELIGSHKGQIEKIKEGIRAIDDRLNSKLREKFQDSDSKLYAKMQELGGRYNEHIAALADKLSSVEDSFNDRLYDIELKYKEKGESAYSKQYDRLQTFSSKIDGLSLEFNELKNRLDRDIAEQIAGGKEELKELNRQAINEFKENIDSYRRDIFTFKNELANINDKLNGKLYENLNELDRKSLQRVENIQRRYTDTLRELNSRFEDASRELKNRLVDIEHDYRERGEKAYLDNMDKISLFSYRFRELNDELSNLKGRIDSEIKGKIEAGVEQAGKIIDEKNRAILSEFKTLEDESNERINQYRREMLSLREALTTIERRYDNKLSGKLGSVDREVAFKLELLATEVNSVEDEFKSRLDEIERGYKEKGEAAYSENSGKLSKFKERFETLNGQISELQDTLEDKVEAEVNKGLANMERLIAIRSEEIESKYRALEDEGSQIINRYTRDIEQLKGDITQLSIHFEKSFGKKLEEVDGRLYNALEKLNDSVESVQFDFFKKLDEIDRDYKERGDQALEDNLTRLSAFSERFNSLNREVQLIESQIKEKIENGINSGIDQAERLYDEKQSRFKEQFENVESRLKSRIENLGEATRSITVRYESDLSELKQSLKQVDREYSERLSDKYSEIDSRLAGKMKDVNDVVEQIREVSGRYKSRFKSFEERLSGLEEDFTHRLDKIEESYSRKGEAIFQDKSALLEGIDQKFNSINEDVNRLKDSLKSDIELQIEEGKRNVDRLFLEKSSGMEEVIKEIESDTLARMESYRVESERLNGYLEELDREFSSRISSLLQSADENVGVRIRELNSEYSRHLEELKGSVSHIESEFSGRAGEIEAYYRSKSDSLLAEKLEYISTLEERLSELDGAVRATQSELEDGIRSAVESGRGEVESLLASGFERLVSEYNSLESETSESIGRYRRELESVRKNIVVLDGKFTGRFLKKLNSADVALKSRLERLNSEYKSYLDRYNSDFIAGRESELELYNERVSGLAAEISELKDSLGREIGEQIAAGRGEVESLVVEGKGELNSLISGGMDELSALSSAGKGELNSLLEDGKAELSSLAASGRDELSTLVESSLLALSERQGNLSGALESLVSSCHSELSGLQSALATVDEQLRVELKRRFSLAGDSVESGLKELESRYLGQVKDFSSRLGELESGFVSRLDELKSSYAERGESSYREQEARLQSLSGRLSALSSEFSELKGRVEHEIAAEVAAGRAELEEFSRAALGDFKRELSLYHERFSRFEGELSRVESLLNERFSARLGELDEESRRVMEASRLEYRDSVSELNHRFKALSSEFKSRLLELESGYRERGDDVFSESREQLSELTGRFNSLNRELESLKGRIDSEIEGRIEAGVEQAGRIIGEKNRAILSEFKTLEAESTSRIESYRRELLSLKSELSSLEERYSSELSGRLDVADSRLSERLSTLSGRMSEVESVFQSRLLELESVYREQGESSLVEQESRLSRFREQFSELGRELEQVRVELEKKLESDVRAGLAGMEELISERFRALEAEGLKLLNSYSGELGELKSDMKALSVHFEKSFGEKLSDVDSRLLSSLDELKIRVESVEYDFFNRLDDIEQGYRERGDEAIESNLARLSAFSERFQSLHVEMSGLEEQLKDRIESGLSRGLSLVDESFSIQESALKSELESLESRVKSRIENLGESTRAIAERYESDLSELKRSIKQVDRDYSERLSDKYSEIDSRLAGKMKDVNDVVEQIREVSGRYQSRLSGFEGRVKDLENDLLSRLDSVEADYRSRGEALFNDRSALLEGLDRKFNSINADVNRLKDSLSSDIDARIEAGKSSIDRMLCGYDESLSSRIREIESDTLARMESYRVESERLNGYLEELDREFSSRISSLLQSADENVGERIRELNSEYSRHLEELKGSVSHIESEFSGRAGEIEAYYRSKSDSLLAEKLEYISTLEKRLGSLSSEIKHCQHELENEIANTVESGRSDIKALLENGFNRLVSEYNNLESETQQSISCYRRELEVVKNNIELIDEKYSGRFLKKLNSADEELKAKLETLNGEYKNYLEKYNSDFIEGRESELELYNGRVASLAAEIAELKESLGREIGEQITAGRGEVETLMSGGKGELENILADGKDELKTMLSGGKEEIETLLNQGKKELEREIVTFNERLYGFKDEVGKLEILLSGLDEQTRLKLKETGESYAAQVAALNNRFRELTDDYNGRIRALEAGYKERNEQSFRENREELYRLTARFEGLNGELSHLKGRIDSELENRVGESVAKVEEMLAKKSADYEQLFKELEEESRKRLNENKLELEKLNKLISTLDESYKAGVTERLNRVDEKVVIQVKELNRRIEAAEYDFAGRLDEIRANYELKGSRAYEESLNTLGEYRSSFVKLQDELNKVRESVLKEIGEDLEGGREQMNELINQGEERLNNSLKVYEEMAREKFKQLESEIGRVKSDVMALGDNFTGRYTEKLDELDQTVKERYSEIVDSYQENVALLQERLELLGEDYSKRLEVINNDSEERGYRVAMDYEQKYQHFVDSFKVLSMQLADLKEMIDGEIDERIKLGLEGVDSALESHREESVERINVYRTELHKIEQKIKQFGDSYKEMFYSKSGEYEEKFSQKIGELEERYEERLTKVEVDYFKRGEKFVAQSLEQLDLFHKKFDYLKERVQGLEVLIDEDVEKKIGEGKSRLKELLENEIAEMKDYYSKVDQDLYEKLKEYNGEVNSLQKSMKQIDDRFTARFLDHSSQLDKRIADIEGELKKVEKQTALIEKASSFKEKLSGDIKVMKDYLGEIKQDKADIVEIEKRMGQVEGRIKEADLRYNELFDKSKEAETISETIEQLKQVTESVDEKLDGIRAAKFMIADMEASIEEINGKFRRIELNMKQVEFKEEEIKESLNEMKGYKEVSKGMTERIQVMEKHLSNLEFKKETFDKSLKRFEKEASIITQSEHKVTDVMDRFRQMDSLVEDLEIRTVSINKIREWLVRAETQIENLNYETDKRIKLLESLVEKSGQDPVLKERMKDDYSKKELIVQLQRQGWTIDDIAKTLNLSIGEVEFILDLELSGSKSEY